MLASQKLGDVCAVELKLGGAFALWYLAKIIELADDGETILKVCVAYEDFDRDEWLYCAIIEDTDFQEAAFCLAVAQGGLKGYASKDVLKQAITALV